MKNLVVFSDFDGTITKEDTLNKFLHIYADSKWLEIENRWINNEIGSKECIEEQMKLVSVPEQEKMDKFIESIEIDETFPDFYNYLRKENIAFYIVSDGFDYFISKILKKHGIDDAKIFSNKLEIKDGKFYTYFPNTDVDCKRKSGVCKCKIVDSKRKSNTIVTNRVLYAGDGLSDFCVSDRVDFLFAKGSLLEYCKNTQNDNLFGFNSFDEIKGFIEAYK